MKCIHSVFGLILLAFAFTPALPANLAHAQASETPQDDNAVMAEGALRTLNNGLTSHNAVQFLSAFDPDRMPDYSNFADQVQMFFGTYDNFRVHYQILEVRLVSDKSASVTANLELQADSATGDGPGVGRNGQLHLTISSAKNGWKITGLQPREFFR